MKNMNMHNIKRFHRIYKLLSLVLVFLLATGCVPVNENKIAENGVYDQKDDVALYIYTYHKLPENYITKEEARILGWEGGSLSKVVEGKCIGGDYYGNYEGTLPEDEAYHECDINTLHSASRGAERIVYSEDWDIYYTEDHYETFELLYEGDN